MPINASIGGGLRQGLMAWLGAEDEKKMRKDELAMRERLGKEREKTEQLKTRADMQKARQGNMTVNPFQWRDGMTEDDFINTIANTRGLYDPLITPEDAAFKLDTQAGQQYYGKQLEDRAKNAVAIEQKKLEDAIATEAAFLGQQLDVAKQSGIPISGRGDLGMFQTGKYEPAIAQDMARMRAGTFTADQTPVAYDLWKRGEEAATTGKSLSNTEQQARNNLGIVSLPQSGIIKGIPYNIEPPTIGVAPDPENPKRLAPVNNPGGMKLLELPEGINLSRPGSKGSLRANPAEAQKILDEAGGDPVKAEQIAIQRGWTVD